MGLVNVDRRYSGDTIAVYIWNMGSDNGGDSVDFCGWLTLYAYPSGWGFLVGLIWLVGNASRGAMIVKSLLGLASLTMELIIYFLALGVFGSAKN
jgi:hypothetical protein